MGALRSRNPLLIVDGGTRRIDTPDPENCSF